MVTVTPEIKKYIQTYLKGLEEEKDISILYACESGSRIWGFHSPDSDYDVRFIYAHKRDWYLTIYNKRDVIERKGEHDTEFVGWDIKKALHLLKKSNPPLLEWLTSPIRYGGWSGPYRKLKELTPDYYSPIACMYHYLHLASGNYKDFLRREVPSAKKCLYVLRAIMSCRWIEQDRGVVPVEFDKLTDTIDGETYPGLLDNIKKLVWWKKLGSETVLVETPNVKPVVRFIEAELVRLKEVEDMGPAESRDTKRLDEVFRWILDWDQTLDSNQLLNEEFNRVVWEEDSFDH